jgi:DNA-binding transcriptional MerR regulator
VDGIGITEVVRRCGLTREQIVYLDERGLLGAVARQREARRFSEAQASWLDRYAALRSMGLSQDQAAAIATAQTITGRQELQTLCAVASTKAVEIQKVVAAWVYLCSLISDSVASAATVALSPAPVSSPEGDRQGPR